MTGEQAQVDQHADADEKHAEQYVAKRPQIGLDLVPVVAFPQQHAGEKCAQGRGETDQVRQPGGQQDDHQGQQDEQFRRASRRDLMEQARQYPATGQGQPDEQHHGFAQGQGQRPIPGLIAVAGEHRHQGQQQHRDHVLEQQNADGILAVAAENLAEAGQLLADNGRGRQRQAATE